MADLSKLKAKFGDVQKIMDSVKSMLNPVPIPESAKDNPIGYRLTEIVKTVKTLVDNHNKQSDELAKLDVMLGELVKELKLLVASEKKGSQPAQKMPQEKPHIEEESKKISEEETKEQKEK